MIICLLLGKCINQCKDKTKNKDFLGVDAPHHTKQTRLILKLLLRPHIAECGRQLFASVRRQTFEYIILVKGSFETLSKCIAKPPETNWVKWLFI